MMIEVSAKHPRTENRHVLGSRGDSVKPILYPIGWAPISLSGFQALWRCLCSDKTGPSLLFFWLLTDTRPTIIYHLKRLPVAGSLAGTASHIISDERSFALLFDDYYSRLCLFAHRIIHHHDAAEDLVQECFIKLWDQKDGLVINGSLSSYLYSMVRNRCINFLRDHARIHHLAEELVVPTENNALHAMIEAETFYELYKGIERLPQKCREVATLLFIEGRTHEETAQLLRVTESTVRTQKARAVAFLRQRLWVAKSLLNIFLH